MSDTKRSETVTYRGRSLEEVLPRIRAELGPDAVIERQRTGLVGGVGGFFQREMVEVDARPARPEEKTRLDVVTGDEDRAAPGTPAAPTPDPDRDAGLGSPGMRRIARQSEPFADLLADAQADLEPLVRDGRDAAGADAGPWAGDDDVPRPLGPPAAHAAAAYRNAGRAEPAGDVAPPERPEPRADAGEPDQDRHDGTAGAEAGAGDGEAAAIAEPARTRPPAAGRLEAALTAGGLTPRLAAEVVADAVSHGLPFAPPRSGLKRQVRAMLARRIPVQARFGGAGRTIALAGPAGSGKTRAAAGLAAAYAAGSDLPVVVVSLGREDDAAELAELLDGHGVPVHAAAGGAAARDRIAAHAGRALAVVDTPAVSPRDDAAVAALAGDLRAAGVTETHVVLPATLAGPVARDALAAFAPLVPTALLITHLDETDHVGPLVDLAIADGVPFSYVASGPAGAGTLTLADPAVLAARLVP